MTMFSDENPCRFWVSAKRFNETDGMWIDQNGSDKGSLAQSGFKIKGKKRPLTYGCVVLVYGVISKQLKLEFVKCSSKENDNIYPICMANKEIKEAKSELALCFTLTLETIEQCFLTFLALVPLGNVMKCFCTPRPIDLQNYR